jgi:ABC-type dipeptide/oligopeptide/nickel transport system ATPase component
MILQIKDLSVTYAGVETKALNAVSFTVQKEEIVGVVGESGSGKSTLANAVIDLLPLDAKKSGAVIFNDKDIYSLSEKELCQVRGNDIGMIFQEPGSTFNPVLSIGYQFDELLRIKLKMKKAERLDSMTDILKKVKIHEGERILKSYPHQLSGGQLQRIAIAMALSLSPKLLIADEPTSSLDVTTESQIIYLFREIRESLKVGILFITHNLDLVWSLCDRVVVLQEGRVKEIKEKNLLFTQPSDPYTKTLLAAFKKLDE